MENSRDTSTKSKGQDSFQRVSQERTLQKNGDIQYVGLGNRERVYLTF